MKMLFLRTVSMMMALTLTSATPMVRSVEETTATPCELNCENGGHCVTVPGDEEALKMLVQQGEMIQRCVCPFGFSGMGCEQDHQQCDIRTLTCPLGNECTLSSAGVGVGREFYNCDCSIADTLSATAARLCRRTYTEYCSAEYVEGKPLSYCTNGGKCKGGFIAARIAPGNTTVNAQYEQTGCVCPTEFYGPHCEFMIQSSSTNVVLQTEVYQANPDSQLPTSTKQTSLGSADSIQQIIDDYNTKTEVGKAIGEIEADVASAPTPPSSGFSFLKGFVTVLSGAAVLCGIIYTTVYFHRKGKLPRRKRRKKKRNVVAKTAYAGVERPVQQGSANLKPFVLDDDDNNSVQYDDDAVTTTTSHWGSQSGDSGWIASMSNALDAYGIYSIGDDADHDAGAYVVDDDDDDDDDNNACYDGGAAIGSGWKRAHQDGHFFS